MRPPVRATTSKNEVAGPQTLKNCISTDRLIEAQPKPDRNIKKSISNNEILSEKIPEFCIVDLNINPSILVNTTAYENVSTLPSTSTKNNTTSNFFLNHINEKPAQVDSRYSFNDSLLLTGDQTLYQCLSHSETDPLVTGEETVPEKDRKICLQKNGVSLTFTKKEIAPSTGRHNRPQYANSSSCSSLEFAQKSVDPKKTHHSSINHRQFNNPEREHYSRRDKNHQYYRKSSGRRTHHRLSLPSTYDREIAEGQSLINHSNYPLITNTTAARKEHAYSWYAPVYSALEEELEQDSRDSSPVHNLANIKKTPYRPVQSSDIETASLLGSKDHNNIQPQLHRTKRSLSSPHTPASLQLPFANNLTHPTCKNNITNGNNSPNNQQNDDEGPQAATLLAGGPTPRRRRFENFLKSLVGRKPSKDASFNPPLLPSPEITLTKTLSDESLGGQSDLNQGHQSPEDSLSKKISTTSTTSLNAAVQQKLWNVVPLLRRDGSAASLHHEKSQSIVHYTGMRKCETVLALTRQTASVCSPVSDISSYPTDYGERTGSALIVGANGVERIRPLNRLRHSVSVSNATCSRCSSLLSLAASSSRYSLNTVNSGLIHVTSHSNNLNNSVSKSNDCTDNISDKSSRKNSTNTNDNGPPSDVTTATLNSSSWSESSPLSPVICASASAIGLAAEVEEFTCKLCIAEVSSNEVTAIAQCGCQFCTECMKAYIEFEISEGAYEISCPDADCPSQGIITLNEIDKLVPQNLVKKHHRYRLNREIELDKFRTWCPRAGCETVCLIGCTSDSALGQSTSNSERENAIEQAVCAVQCPSCKVEFCSGCKKPWHPNLSCDENSRQLATDGQDDIGIPFDNELIKCCPMCAVPIEKDEGCAQMMCKRCKHVFCWYCLASLDDDFLLRHYDKGPCKNKLGHSRASVVWHRAQVIGIFAGFGILLLVASPLLLLAAPCIICCKCRICSGGNKIDEVDGDTEEAAALQS